MKIKVLFLGIVLGTALASCGGEGANQDSVAVEEASIKTVQEKKQEQPSAAESKKNEDMTWDTSPFPGKRKSLEPLSAGKIQPFKVNDEIVTKEEIERALVYTLGRNLLERKIVTFLVEEELQNRISAGADPAGFRIIGDEIESRAEEAKSTFEQQNPDIDFEKALQSQGYTLATFKEDLATALAFEKLFLPSDPREWPPITREIIKGKGAGAILEGFDKKIEEGEEVPELPDLLKQGFRTMLIQELKNNAKIKFASDGLPADTVVSVNGKQFKTQDALKQIEHLLEPARVVQTLEWLAVTDALRQALEKEGVYLSESEFQEELQKHKAPYEDSIFPLEGVVLNFKGFPTMESYYTYFHLLSSYRKKIGDDLENEEILKEHFDSSKIFFQGGAVQAAAFLAGTFDFISARPGGPKEWEAAKKKAEEARRKIENGADFMALVEEESDFPDFPGNPKTPNQPRHQKGKFSALQKNPFRQLIGETDFQYFISGYSLADRVFDPEVKGILGPYPGPYGYYIFKILSKAPGKTSQFDEGNKKALVQEDYLNHQFVKWGNEVLAETKIAYVE